MAKTTRYGFHLSSNLLKSLILLTGILLLNPAIGVAGTGAKKGSGGGSSGSGGIGCCPGKAECGNLSPDQCCGMNAVGGCCCGVVSGGDSAKDKRKGAGGRKGASVVKVERRSSKKR